MNRSDEDDPIAHNEPFSMKSYLASPHSLNCLLLMLAFLAALAVPELSAAQGVTQARSQSYFIQQGSNEDLLITISAFEAEFESRVSGPNGEVLLFSGITGSRIVPVFQYIYAPKSNRQLDIEVTSSLHTSRTEFGIELTRLKPWDSRSSSVSQAYRLLSFGTEIDGADTPASWTVKIDSLANAGRLFRQYGMQEMQLWANYLAAHLVLFQLHDHSFAYSMTGEILSELKGTRLQKIELATLQLRSLASIGLRKSGSLSVAAGDADPVQAVLGQTAALAQAMGYQYEQARALYASGLDYAEQSSYTKALEQFQLAVQIADAVGSAEMAKEIRESIVQIHTIQGDAPATSEVLQEIESQLVEGGGGDELALNLLAQARLLIGVYQYDEAMDVLSGALNYQNNSAIRRQINFELAKILYETGRPDQSLAFLKLAGIDPDSAQKRRGNLVIDVGEGLRIMANQYRLKGEFERMQAARRAQGQYQPLAAQYLYDQGLDSMAEATRDRQKAASFFRQSHASANTAGEADLRHLALLQYCALAEAVDAMCARAGLKTSYEWLNRSGLPTYSLDAMYLWAQLLVVDGQRQEALPVMDRLIDEIHMLNHSLPGVLGAWYWDRHEQIFDSWLGMLIADSRQSSRADGSASLLALSKIRYVEGDAYVKADSSADKSRDEPLRVQIAQRADPAGGLSRLALNEKINMGLDMLRADFRGKFSFLSSNGLQEYLRGLANDESVLTYHLGPRLAQVWVANKGGVQRRDIANPAQLYRTMQETRQGLNNAGLNAFDRKMDDLGKRLIAPVSDILTETIYWIPAGPLMAFPVDALRINGHYLLEKHHVVNLLSFPANTHPANSLQAGALTSVFLAGNPQDYAGDYATRLETSAEIQAVADLFVGPGLQIVQGVALLPDEFQGGYFSQSKLIHLSTPGVINLEYPGDSGLELSESEYEPGRGVLMAADIRSQKLSASLVFLSSTRLVEGPRSDFASQPGLVSDFISAGAHSLVVNFWAANTESDARFINDFYRALQDSGNISESLRRSRLQYLKNSRGNSLYDWAGYQLYIR